MNDDERGRQAAWYLDTIDARAGLAFATHRVAAPAIGAAPFEDGPALFIEPPFFTAQTVASRTVGLALAHRHGQAGVYVDGAELAFDSLAAIEEFVRRAYLRGSAGDGGGENGVPPPVAPDGGDDFVLPPLRTKPGEYDGYGAAFTDDPTVDAVAMWRGQAGELAFRSERLVQESAGDAARSQPAGPAPFAAASARTDMTVQRICRGAVTTLRALYRVRIDRPDDERTLAWSDAAQRLLDLITRMALWPMMRGVFAGAVDPAAALGVPTAAPAVTEAERRFFRMLEHDDWRAGLGGWWGIVHDAPDPFETLALMPVPERLLRFDASIAPNLQALLTVAVSTPAALLPGRRDDDAAARFELALFAAACLNARDDGRTTSWTHPHDLSGIVVARLTRRTLAWLGANLPTTVYAPPTEQLLESASGIVP